jgi:hypothetical protein
MLSGSKKPGVLLPPAVGYSFKILVRLCRNNKISFRFYPRLLIITLINLINFPFRTYERVFINPKYYMKTIQKEPVFIIGHWRSGTTHLHNLLCQDPQMAYTSTYQSVFPDTMFNWLGRFLFKNFTRLLIPGKRKGDNVQLGPSYPQEEEFALGDKVAICYYYFWLFPRKMKHFYDTMVRMEGVQKKVLDRWKKEYKLLFVKALKNTGRDRLLSKNPTNTGRIKVLLEMFPNAKFIHIHRNPVEVFLSTRHFYQKMLPPLQLQTISQDELDNHLIQIYKDLMHDYLAQKKLIPEGNLIELSFTELEQNPDDILKRIYAKLNLEGYEFAKPMFDAYNADSKSYKKNTHRITAGQLRLVQDEWGFAMKTYDYTIPKNIEIIND